ncbi:MAG TPA: elongation factor P [Deferrisomatales bacterium]|nr:elongation factor P [Deferrisomatales bacterium]
MYRAADLRKGLKIELDGEPHLVVTFEFTKPGKGQAMYRCRLRNMITGNQFDRTYRSGDSFKPASLESRVMTYLFNDGQFYTFMDQKTYEQYQISAAQLGDVAKLLTDNLEVEVLVFDDKPIDVSLPNFVTLVVAQADPAARGDTATGVTKLAVMETGYELYVPGFIEEGDKIQIDTRTGEYATRSKE